MTFRIEGDYIIYDHRRIARLLPSLALCDLRAAEEALTDFEPAEPEPTSIATPSSTWPDALEKLRALAVISGGLLSWDEIEDALS